MLTHPLGSWIHMEPIHSMQCYELVIQECIDFKYGIEDPQVVYTVYGV